MELYIKQTSEMTPLELVKVFQARVRVFVIEQNCLYEEVDDADLAASHVMLKDGDEIVAYARIIEHDTYISFGRVLVAEKYRQEGFGRKIVQLTIDAIRENYPPQTIKISGQAHLKSFYESFGFHSVSDVYLEDNIPHITLELYANE
ncbi:GNAT family N-acetyltransferase [Staphylococcus caeli]|uniref:GNAT family N-acetyltransferase n=1 Tax=Staphylococcus caeli TaxID=2201815 RepID=UPI003F5745BC